MTNKQTYYFAATFWDGPRNNGTRIRLTGLNKREAQRLYRLTSKLQLQAWSDGGEQVGRTPYSWSWGVEEDGMRRVADCDATHLYSAEPAPVR